VARVSVLIPASKGPKRYAAASSGIEVIVVGSARILRTAVIAINVYANAAAIDGTIIKYHSRVLTSPSVTSRGSLRNSIAVYE
jgi:hypothetical protein